MLINIHATIQFQEGRLIHKIGSPSDHQLEGGYLPYKMQSPQNQMEITLWSRHNLSRIEVDRLGNQVLRSMGMAS